MGCTSWICEECRSALFIGFFGGLRRTHSGFDWGFSIVLLICMVWKGTTVFASLVSSRL